MTTVMRMARRGKSTRNFECRYHHKDGRIALWVPAPLGVQEALGGDRRQQQPPHPLAAVAISSTVVAS